MLTVMLCATSAGCVDEQSHRELNDEWSVEGESMGDQWEGQTSPEEVMSDLPAEDDVPGAEDLQILADSDEPDNMVSDCSNIQVGSIDLYDGDSVYTYDYETDGNDSSIKICFGTYSTHWISLGASLYRKKWGTDEYLGYKIVYTKLGDLRSATWSNISSNKDYYFRIQELWGDGHSNIGYGISSW